MSIRSGLYSATISKVLNREGGVDKHTIEKLFSVFNLKILDLRTVQTNYLGY